MARRNTFSAGLEAFAKKTGLTLDQVHRGVCIKLFGAVVMDTPVLDGDLRGSWQISGMSPNLSVPNRKDKSGATVTAEIRNFPMKAGTITYFSNSQPYAYRIEYEGWSHTKAPAGMVRKNVARFQQIINEATAEVRK